MSSDLTNFPFLIDLTDTDLASKAQVSGYDLVFTDSSGTGKLNHEIESYTPATGHLVAWVQIPSLSSVTDTPLYVYYGNPSASDQQNKNAVWDSDYKMVAHLSETSGTQHDSTSNGYSSVPNGGVSEGVVGKISGADSFTSSSQYLAIGNIGVSGDWTFSFWAYSRDVGCIACYPIGLGTSPNQATGIGVGGTYVTITNGFWVFDGSGDAGIVQGGPKPTVNTWYYVTVTKSGTTYTVYDNGISQKSGTLQSIAINNLVIGRRFDGMLPFSGIVDEARASDIPRSAAWTLTEYDNQNNPSTFLTVGAEESTGAPTVSQPSPSNGQTNVPTTTSQLSFTLSSSGGAPMDYTVSTSPSVGSGQGSQVASGVYSVPVSGLQSNTAYAWSVDATAGSTHTHASFTFTTETFSRTITSYSPSAYNLTLDRSGSQTFQIDFNGPVDITWYLDGTPGQHTTGVSSSTWSNTFSQLGIFNVTAAGTFNGVTLQQTWSVQAIINFSGGVTTDGNLYFGPSQPWENGWVFDESVWHDNGMYYMLYAGSPIGSRKIGFAWSYDGLHWTKDPNNPILSPVPGTWENQEVFWPSTIIKMEDGSYRVYYQGIDTSGGRHSGIFFMTLSGPTITSLTRYSGNPVVADTYELSVIRVSQNFWIGYNGYCLMNLMQSTDGLTWNYVQMNVLTGSSWDNGCIYAGHLLIMDGTLYVTVQEANQDVGLVYARVGDWANLHRSPHNPIIPHGSGYSTYVLGGNPIYNSTLDALDTWFLSVASLGGSGASGIGFGRLYHVTGAETPPIISTPSPSNGATNVPISTSSLSFNLMEPSGNAMSYTVTTSPNVGGNTGTGVHDGQYSVNISGLSYSTTYTWTVSANDGAMNAQQTFTFTTESNPNLDPFANGWQYRKSITINHNQVTGDQTNFPILVDITDQDLSSKACQSGGDIIFMNGAGEATKIAYQTVDYNPTTGHLTAWVNVPTLSSTSDTTIYMYYGNPACSPQQNPPGVWDSNFLMVLHLDETSGIQYDSTVHHNDGTPHGVTQGVTGEVGYADSFSGTGYVESTNDASLSPTTITVSAWINPSTASGTNPIIEKYDWGVPGNGGYLLRQQDGNVFFDVLQGATDHLASANSIIQIGSSTNVVGTFDGTTVSIYVNGVLINQVAYSGTIQPSTSTLKLGTRGNDATPSSKFFSGVIDEAWASKGARSASWIATEYNSQHSPSTFTALGSEETNIKTTTVTLTAISTLMTAGQTAIPFSGAVAPTTVPDGVNVELRYAPTCIQGSAGTAIATASTSGGNGEFSGTFTAPTSDTYQFWAYFIGVGSYSNASSTCQQITVTPTPPTIATITLNELPNPLIMSQTDIQFSGSASPPSGTANINVELRYASTCLQGSGGTLAATQQVNGNGEFSGTFTAPANDTYQFWAHFVGGNGYDSASSECQQVTVTPLIIPEGVSFILLFLTPLIPFLAIRVVRNRNKAKTSKPPN